jgi:hypothetical protein
MNDAHVYEMQVQMWKPNTWGVTLATFVSLNKFMKICSTIHLMVQIMHYNYYFFLIHI